MRPALLNPVSIKYVVREWVTGGLVVKKGRLKDKKGAQKCW